MTLNLYLDITNRRLVRSFDSDTAFTLPSWFQGDDIVLNIFPLIPASDPSQGPFRYAELQGTTLRAALCGGSGRPAGTDGSSTYLAYQDAFTAIEHGFTGNLSLATEELATFIGAQSSASSTFEIEVTDGDGNKTTVLQAPQTINAEVIEVGTLTPAQQPSYFTKTESNARFALQSAGGGNVSGPSAAPGNGEIVAFDGATGRQLKTVGKTLVQLMSDVGSAISSAISALGLGGAATKDVGTITGTVCAADDSRLSNSRTPTAHKTSHSTGESDALAPSDIGAAAATHASRHQNGGADEIATATPTANAIPKAGSGGTLDAGWFGGGSGISALAQTAANATIRLALTSKPLGYRVYQLDNHHAYELVDLSNIANERGWIDWGDVLPYAPTMTAAPTISGTPTVGTAYTATTGTAAGRPTPTLAWKWQTSTDSGSTWSDISGATSASYTPVSGDVGNLLRVGQQASNALGDSGWSFSDASGAVTAAGGSWTGLAFFAIVNTAMNGLSATFNSGEETGNVSFAGISPGDSCGFYTDHQTDVVLCDHISEDGLTIYFQSATINTNAGIQMWALGGA